MTRIFNQIKKESSLWTYTFRRIDPLFKLILLGAILCVINYECKILTISTKSNFLIGINSIIAQTLTAYITGFIFYFIIELNTKSRKRIAVFRLIHNNSFNIDQRINLLLEEIIKQTDPEYKDLDVNEDMFKTFCDKITKESISKNTWLYRNSRFDDYLLLICDDIKKSINEIMVYADLLDEKWLNLLSNIYDTTSFIENHSTKYRVASLPYGHILVLFKEIKELTVMNKGSSDTYLQSRKMNPPGKYFPSNLVIKMRGGRIF